MGSRRSRGGAEVEGERGEKYRVSLGAKTSQGFGAVCGATRASASDGNRTMKHPKEEELIAYHDGEAAGREGITAHLGDCPECQAELARIDALLAALNTIPVPEPEEDYGQRVWQQISPRLPPRRARSGDL